LAGGFGTRLRSAVQDVPKPLAPVMGRPYLAYLIESWLAQGITSLTFLLHYEAKQIQDFLTEFAIQGGLGNCSYRTLIEPEPLGTGGAIAYAVQTLQIDEPFLVANADTWLGKVLPDIQSSTSPAMGIIEVENTARYGQVRFTEQTITAFEEKQVDKSAPGWINAGLYHLDPQLFSNWDGQPFSLEKDLFPTLVDNHELTAVKLKSDFIDIGIPADYFKFCHWIETNRKGSLCS
jgi:NDP-sugar pyrophosphorylase family protein